MFSQYSEPAIHQNNLSALPLILYFVKQIHPVFVCSSTQLSHNHRTAIFLHQTDIDWSPFMLPSFVSPHKQIPDLMLSDFTTSNFKERLNSCGIESKQHQCFKVKSSSEVSSFFQIRRGCSPRLLIHTRTLKEGRGRSCCWLSWLYLGV